MEAAEPSSAESAAVAPVVAAAAADCPGRGFLATRSDCDRSTRAALPAVPFAAGSLPAAGGGSGAFFFRPVPYLLSVSGRECNLRNCARPRWIKLQVVSPVPDEDEAVEVVVATMGAVLRTVGDGLANLAGLGGVAGGVREDDFFGFSDDVFVGFGLFASVAAFAFSSNGFFASF